MKSLALANSHSEDILGGLRTQMGHMTITTPLSQTVCCQWAGISDVVHSKCKGNSQELELILFARFICEIIIFQILFGKNVLARIMQCGIL